MPAPFISTLTGASTALVRADANGVVPWTNVLLQSLFEADPPVNQKTSSTASKTGSPVISTAQKYAGTSSLLIDASTEYYEWSTIATGFGTGDFCFEFWLRISSRNDAPVLNTGAYNVDVDIRVTSSTGLAVYVASGSPVLSEGTTTLLDQWVHYAVQRKSGTLSICRNGTQTATTANSTSLPGTGTKVRVGWLSLGSDGSLPGYIDNVRVSNYAPYTSPFTPPATYPTS